MRTRAKVALWASEVFGCRVGNLDVDAPPSVEAIKDRNRGRFEVVFVRAPGWHDPQGRVVALDYLYDMEQITPFRTVCPSKLSKLSAFNARQLRIAKTAFSESRFMRDPILSKKAPDMYLRWLSENPAYVLTDAPDSAFLVATKDRDGARRISLMAVSKEKQGRGLGRRLARSVFSEKSPEVWRVKVSARNHRAVRFYETVGFVVKDVWTAFHVWIGKGW